MECEDARRLVHAYVDGELDLTMSLEVEDHLAGCSDCSREQRALLALRDGLVASAPYFRPPAALEARVEAAVRGTSRGLAPAAGPAAQAAAERSGRRRPAGAGWLPWQRSSRGRKGSVRRLPGWYLPGLAALALVAVLAWGLLQMQARSQQENLVAQEAMASSVRSLIAGPLTDVQSSDQHTVKPWFAGKLDFSPTVQDFAAQGFPLAGGRVDYVDGRPVAALVYRHGPHVVNLYTWPAAPGADAPLTAHAIQGYNLLHWTQGGAIYWAVSDMDAGELRDLASLVRGTS